jgi:23S rRNA pseudouridine2605 synthase
MADAIKQQRVLVNGAVVESFKQEFDPARDSLTLDGGAVAVLQNAPVYIMLNKPTGVLSTTRDENGRRTVLDLLPAEYRKLNLHPVGRLDMDSSGLLLLTNDGDLTHRLTHPSFEKEKEYVLTLDRKLDPADKTRFEHGLELEDGMTWPTSVKESNSAPATYRVILHEGRKRQLRRMFASLGYRVGTLKRIRIGTLLLGDLREGEIRVLLKAEIQPIDAQETAKAKRPGAVSTEN